MNAREDAWQSRAECRGYPNPGAFFPGQGEPATEALSVCARCPVMNECREYALQYPCMTGVWGGLSERTRRRVRQARARAQTVTQRTAT